MLGESLGLSTTRLSESGTTVSARYSPLLRIRVLCRSGGPAESSWAKVPASTRDTFDQRPRLFRTRSKINKPSK